MDELLSAILEPVGEILVSIVFEFFEGAFSRDLGDGRIQKLLDSDRK